jgi:hypothetical protein
MKGTIARAGRGLSWVLPAALLVVAGSGCSQSKVQVQGVIKLDGKPVEQAQVQFFPIGGHGQQATGYTDSNGVFQLQTRITGDGVWPGEYKVLVDGKYEAGPAVSAPIDQSDPKRAASQMYMADAKARAKPKKNVVPPVYGNQGTTPLRWKVPEDNNKTLELSSTAK